MKHSLPHRKHTHTHTLCKHPTFLHFTPYFFLMMLFPVSLFSWDSKDDCIHANFMYISFKYHFANGWTACEKNSDFHGGRSVPAEPHFYPEWVNELLIRTFWATEEKLRWNFSRSHLQGFDSVIWAQVIKLKTGPTQTSRFT